MKKFFLVNTNTLAIETETTLDEKTVSILNYAYALNNFPLRCLTDKVLNRLKAVQ